MAYLTTADAVGAFRAVQARTPLRKSATVILDESVRSARADAQYDVFLSHCLRDAEQIAGVKAYLETQGVSVYVDWIEDRQLDRTKVTPATADLLRQRMRQSASLMFATSESSPDSKWMPWELGYFDGLRQGRVAVLPLVAVEGDAFVGQEYLGLYPTVEKLPARDGSTKVFVTRGHRSRAYLPLREFQAGASDFRQY